MIFDCEDMMEEKGKKKRENAAKEKTECIGGEEGTT